MVIIKLKNESYEYFNTKYALRVGPRISSIQKMTIMAFIIVSFMILVFDHILLRSEILEK